MTPLDFIAAVLPSPGNGRYCVVELTSKKKEHVYVERLEETEEITSAWLNSSNDIYFALSTFREKGRRTADNAQSIRTVAIDMDGYATKQAAAMALNGFLETTGLDAFGTPWVVASGGGLHCYWTFREAIDLSIWKPVAENFKRLCKQEKLEIDMTVTADAARVLRIPGTMNFKKKYDTPRPVKLLAESTQPHIDFAEFASFLRSKLNIDSQEPATANVSKNVPKLELPGKRPTAAPSTNSVQLISNSVTKFKNIILATRDKAGCAQLAHYIDNASDDGMEPLWRGWLSIAKLCEDGEKAATWLSGLHPYDEDRMRTKLNEIKGPYPCIKFDSENPGVCTSCKHFGKITNPLMLGREIKVDNSVKEVIVPQIEEDDKGTVVTPVKVYRPSPPKGYDYGVNGGVFCNRMVEEEDGTKRKKQVMVLPYDMFVVDLLNNEGEHTVHMVAMRPDKAVDILMPQRAVVSKDELLKTLAQQNIIAAFGAGNDKNLFEYLRACVEEASVNKKAIRVPTQYGWQEDNSFVYAGKVYYPGGSIRTVPMPDLANITRATRYTGTLDEWRKLPQLFLKRKLHDHIAIMLMSFGSPLMCFTGLNALTFHAGSTQSGTGKSLTLSLLASVWGHPGRYRVGKSTSAVTMQQRCGNLNSLPFVSDEITHKVRADMEWFPGLVFDLSEGQGKEKSEAHVNRERLNNTSWSLLALLTSNNHMQDFMSGVRSHSSQGELFRMLEWTPSKMMEWTSGEVEIIKAINSNYGVAGERWVRWLVDNRQLAHDLTLQSIDRLKTEWEMTGDERFWAAGCGAIVAAAIGVSSAYANILDVSVQEVINALKKLVDKARKVIRNSVRNSDDVLNAFTRDNYGNFVVVRVSDGRLLAELGNGGIIDQSLTRNKIMGRVEHGFTPGYVDYYIEEQVLKAHCVSMSYGFDDFKRSMAETYSVTFGRKDMMAKTKGPQMRVRVMHIRRKVEQDVEIPVATS